MRRTPLHLALLAATLLVAASALPAAAGPGFDVGARGIYWFPSISGDVSYKNETRIDVENDLGLDSGDAPGAEAFARITWFGLRAGYLPVKIDGDATLSRPVTFGGVTFPSGSAVATDVELKTADLELSFAPKITVPWLANLYAGILVKGKLVDGSVSIGSGALKADESFDGVVPMVGLLAGAGVLNDFLRVDARGAGVAYDGNHLYEADGYISLKPGSLLGVALRIQGGYRYLDVKAEDLGDVKASLKLAGPYAGVQLDF